MRVLLVGHSYAAPINRGKLLALAQLMDIDLHVVVPCIWHHRLGTYVTAEDKAQPYRVYALRTLGSRDESRYVFTGDPTIRIARLKPDIIHVEEGAPALVLTQALLMKKRLAPQAKCLLFTWANIPYTIRRPWRAWLEKYNLAGTDHAIAGSSAAESVLRDRGFAAPVSVIPQLGVDPELYKKRNGDPLDGKLRSGTITIGYVGRFVRQKGILTLIEAITKITEDVRLLLVGGGNLKPEIHARAEAGGIARRLDFIDPVPHHDVPAYLNSMDILVLPSLTTPRWKEQFGHVLLEAMACGVPVIGSDSGEIPNVIGDAGLVFEEGNAESLAQKLRQLIQDDALRTELGRRGRQRVLSKYTHHHIAQATFQVYKDLLE